VSNNVVGLLLGLAVILAVTLLLWRPFGRRAGGKAKFSFAKIFDVEVELGGIEKQQAKEALKAAAQERGQQATGGVDAQLEAMTSTRLSRLIWVDDHPDHNRYETLALEQLGFLVTAATSTDVGLFFTDRLSPALAVTDLGRGDDAEAGLDFMARARELKPGIPVIVYTMDADRVRDRIVGLGANAVVDTPEGLVVAVLSASVGSER